MSQPSEMESLVWILICGALPLVLGAKLELPPEEDCESGSFTDSGECCLECPPGEGVIKECGATQTECSQCLDSETFSVDFSHTERCQPCSECTGLMRMQTPCTDSNDAVCVCNYGYFMNEVTGRCEPCTTCPRGEGVEMRCEHSQDTVCEECLDDTYSDQENPMDPCMPCTLCEEGIEIVLRNCTRYEDALCHDPLSTTDPTSFHDSGYATEVDRLWSPRPGDDSTTPKPSSPHFIANQTPSPEGEKLHSDSGISMDSQSLQEQQAQTHTQLHTSEQIVVRVDGTVQPDSPPAQA
ncbi:hypothetical protein DNTS_021342 [Danionella cerebrum]|uniref:TNFR-Cys domain-containing protein n=1 Tax=Danionella cerebrum TaxID=2873325 RepID=A0A553R7W3_9TELE|nr:hypothetical protein DNTS_021342 [Danionella translucida]